MNTEPTFLDVDSFCSNEIATRFIVIELWKFIPRRLVKKFRFSLQIIQTTPFFCLWSLDSIFITSPSFLQKNDEFWMSLIITIAKMEFTNKYIPKIFLQILGFFRLFREI